MIDGATQRRITAEHEAAHALFYLGYGYPIFRIEIAPEAITLSTPTPVRYPVWNLAMISMAGIVIEARHRGHFDLDAEVAEVAEAREWVETGEDPEELGDMALFAQHPQLVSVAFDAATETLQRHRHDHERLTAALLCSDGHLTGEQVNTLDLAVTRLR